MQILRKVFKLESSLQKKTVYVYQTNFVNTNRILLQVTNQEVDEVMRYFLVVNISFTKGIRQQRKVFDDD